MGLLLTNHYRRFEVDMNDDKKFMIAWLEEEMFYVAEEDVCENVGIKGAQDKIYTLTDLL